MPTKPDLPVEIVLFADRPETPVAVFALEECDDDLQLIAMDFDAEEMFRDGCGSTLHMRLLPQRRAS